ncbi:hypothetical protein EJ04DRAFT_176651 [Polyplosphaeria fusca]|uniref:Uncharacterized protein n=1 Tax=Polyplosphaeria fusca TaxID=682080 RepID=A0A9P4R3C1_9PLEO|nr:hypothetical protein EJ04DRAFT_176651 [Polyplosphaeria fusca]
MGNHGRIHVQAEWNQEPFAVSIVRPQLTVTTVLVRWDVRRRTHIRGIAKNPSVSWSMSQDLEFGTTQSGMSSRPAIELRMILYVRMSSIALTAQKNPYRRNGGRSQFRLESVKNPERASINPKSGVTRPKPQAEQLEPELEPQTRPDPDTSWC